MSKERTYKGQSVIDFPEQYIVIDIETTGLSPIYDEIIEIAAIKVEEGIPTYTFSTLVKPTHDIDDFISALTGITNDMLSTAPTLSEVLPLFIDFIGDDILLGHNVNFDINFLYDNIENVLGKHLKNSFIDTMRIFRKLYPSLAHHRLMDLATNYGIDYSRAHRSLTDCKITYYCFKRMIEEISLKYESKQFFINLFKKAPRRTYSTFLKASDIIANTENIDADNPLYGKTFVFTGALEKMLRKEAMQIVVNFGGINGDNVTKSTNYLVLGNNDYCKSIKDGKSNKHKKAEALKLSGHDIEIISENVFYDMISE